MMDVQRTNSTSPASKKRSHDGEMINTPSKPSASVQADMEPAMLSSRRQQSPALSTTSSSLSELTPSVTASAGPIVASVTPAKKRKMTFAEREVAKALKQQEKEDKEKQKADEKARKEEEKRARDEEKRKKEEEKEATRRERELEKIEKQKAKDAKKQARETEKAKEEVEKLRKERSQMRLGAFFGRPVPTATPPSSPDDVSSRVSSRRSSIASLDDIERPHDSLKATAALEQEFRKWMPPFFVKENMEVAPLNRFVMSRSQFGIDEGRLIQVLNDGMTGQIDVQHAFDAAKTRRRFTPARVPPVKSLMEQMQGTSNTPIDLTQESEVKQPHLLIDKIPMKFLFHSVDVRPPYQGTYTKAVSPKSSRKMSRNPFHRGLPDTDYDYDSEAEWEEGAEDDEELNEEDDELEEEEDGEDMAEFLDDDNDLTKRRMITGDVQPVSTGLCWEGEPSFENKRADFEQYRMDVLNDNYNLPIDPFSTDYWKGTSKQSPVKVKAKVEAPSVSAQANLMQPPRLPLSTLASTKATVNSIATPTPGFIPFVPGLENATPATTKPASTQPTKPLKLISPDLLPAFKAAVKGSDLTKAGLQEVLKKQFPKVKKDVIKDTLSTIAARVGAKEADKKWVLL